MPGTYAEIPVGGMNAMLRKFERAGTRAGERALELSARALESEAQNESPVRTGFLANSHFSGRTGDLRWVVGANASYALAVHERHPTRRRWLVNAIKANFKRVMGGALKIALREEAGR